MLAPVTSVRVIVPTTDEADSGDVMVNVAIPLPFACTCTPVYVAPASAVVRVPSVLVTVISEFGVAPVIVYVVEVSPSAGTVPGKLVNEYEPAVPLAVPVYGVPFRLKA